VGALSTLKGIPVLVEGTVLLAGSLQLHPEVPAQIKLALHKWLYKDIARQLLYWRAYRPDKQG